MAIYYKATRLEGTDFHTGTVHYVPGETIDVGPRARQYKATCCTGTVLHASTVPTETLIGGFWPCRLFEVQGRPVASEGHKRGFRRLTVVREIDAHEALGPQGVHVATLIDRARRLTRGEIDDLYAARHAASDAARHAASDAALGATWGAARDATWDAALGAARNAARDATWDATLGAARNAARNAAWGAALGAAWYAASGADWGAARYAVRYAARDTAEALLVRDRISKEDYDALTLPWRSAIGRIHPDDAEVRA